MPYLLMATSIFVKIIWTNGSSNWGHLVLEKYFKFNQDVVFGNASALNKLMWDRRHIFVYFDYIRGIFNFQYDHKNFVSK